jgi:hypothetical protein
VAKTEDVEDGKHFDKDICLQIIPVGMRRTEEVLQSIIIGVVKYIGKIFVGIVVEYLVFYIAIVMIGPCIVHKGEVAIIKSHPTVEDACNYF